MPTLTFTEEDHTYTDETGARWESVTQILTRLGFIDYTGANRAVMEAAMDRGKKVHQAIHYYNEGDLDEEQLDTALVPYLYAYKKFMRESGFVPLELEKVVHNATYRYAGTLDAIGIKDGRSCLIDYKSGKAMAWTSLQCWGYACCLGEPPQDQYALELRRNGTYNLRKLGDFRDRQIWLSLPGLVHWQNNNKGK